MKNDGTIFTLENDELLVQVERHGAQLSRIYDKRADRELLWNADPAVWNRHAPILFPFVGKCYEGSYYLNGQEYQMTPHGFARDMDFEPVLCDSDECWYRLTDTDETYAVYPFHFQIEIGHRLTGRTVEVMWRVENRDSGEILFMMGGHPAFKVPEGKNIYDYTFVFNHEGKKQGENQQSLHYLSPDQDGYEENALSGVLELKNGQTPLTKGFFDRALTYIFDEEQLSSAGLLVDGVPYVTLTFDGFPFLGVWTMEKTHPFVCLEPWYGVCASKGFKGDLAERRGIQKLEAKGVWERHYSIRIE